MGSEPDVRGGSCLVCQRQLVVEDNSRGMVVLPAGDRRRLVELICRLSLCVLGRSVLSRGVRIVAHVLLCVLRAGGASRHRNDDKMVLFDPS